MKLVGYKRLHNNLFRLEEFGMNLQERLEQCRKDKAAIEKEEQELLKQIEKKKKIKQGDIVKTPNESLRRIALYDENKILSAFDKYGNCVGTIEKSGNFYTRTGQNIFDDNFLKLSS